MCSSLDVWPCSRGQYKKSTYGWLFSQIARNSVQLCKNAENSR
ncbi:Uncharacterised protein [Serratia proteamaculans]|nr:Uncharacterised protein [Serratia proteamaculans]